MSSFDNEKMDTANIGTLLGSFVGVFIRAILTDEQLVNWGWRLPFLSGIFIGFVSMYLETHGREHNPNVDENDLGAEKVESKHSLGDVFKRENLPALASATLTPMLYGAGFYTSESRGGGGTGTDRSSHALSYPYHVLNV